MTRCPTTSVSLAQSSPVFCPSAPPLCVSALVTTVSAFASSHRLDYATYLVSGTARSLLFGGDRVLLPEVLEDRGLGFIAAAVPHLCAMLLAPEGDPGALDIPIPRTHDEAVSGPWAWSSGRLDCNLCLRGAYTSRFGSVDQSTTYARLPLSLFIRHSSTPFFVLVYVDGLVFVTPDRRALASVKEELRKRHTCTDIDPHAVLLRVLQGTVHPAMKYVASTSGMSLVFGGKQPVTLTGFLDSSWADNVESLRSTQSYCFSLRTGAAVAMAAQELLWLSFLLTDLGEWPRSPPVLFAKHRSTVLLCEEPRLVGKAKHIQLCYFLSRELQQRGQALVRRVVFKASTADIFNKALPPCGHQQP
ncbi:unnamed protein product [Closterium sp. NIES-53]